MANKSRDILFRAVEVFLSIALLVVFAEVVIEVSARYVFHVPLPWGAEVSQTLLVWITFLGSAEAARRREHMSVTLVLDAIRSKKLRKVLEIAANLIIAVFLVIGTWSGWQVVTKTWSMRTTSLQMPAGLLYLALPVGFVLMILAVVFPSIPGEQRDLPGAGHAPPAGDWR